MVDKVELLNTGLLYLKELGYKFNNQTVVKIKNNSINVKLIDYNFHEDNFNYDLIVNDINVLLEKDLVIISDTCDSYLNTDYSNILRNKKKNNPINPINEIITTIVFSKIDDSVLQSYYMIANNNNKFKTISDKYTNTIVVGDEFDLLKEFPKEKLNKELIKE